MTVTNVPHPESVFGMGGKLRRAAKDSFDFECFFVPCHHGVVHRCASAHVGSAPRGKVAPFDQKRNCGLAKCIRVAQTPKYWDSQPGEEPVQNCGTQKSFCPLACEISLREHAHGHKTAFRKMVTAESLKVAPDMNESLTHVCDASLRALVWTLHGHSQMLRVVQWIRPGGCDKQALDGRDADTEPTRKNNGGPTS